MFEAALREDLNIFIAYLDVAALDGAYALSPVGDSEGVRSLHALFGFLVVVHVCEFVGLLVVALQLDFMKFVVEHFHFPSEFLDVLLLNSLINGPADFFNEPHLVKTFEESQCFLENIFVIFVFGSGVILIFFVESDRIFELYFHVNYKT